MKDERHFDRFDRVFAEHFAGAEKLFEKLTAELPRRMAASSSPNGCSARRRNGASQAWVAGTSCSRRLGKRLREQQGRHEGGNKWIGTAGTSPFGNQGFNPEGVRIGQAGSRQRRAVKVWEARDYRNLDDGVSSARATSRWRCAACAVSRARAQPRNWISTAPSTPRRATPDLLDIQLQPERRNAVKLLLLLDVGGSMDPHVKVCEELFSAARAEFKHLEYFYFHNFPYERLWKDNRRRFSVITDTWRCCGRSIADYRVVFVGDATMSPYEIEQPGGSVEHWNEESGPCLDAADCGALSAPGLAQSRARRPLEMDAVRRRSRANSSANRMFPLTLDGLDRAMRELKRKTPYTRAGCQLGQPPH